MARHISDIGDLGDRRFCNLILDVNVVVCGPRCRHPGILGIHVESDGLKLAPAIGRRLSGFRRSKRKWIVRGASRKTIDHGGIYRGVGVDENRSGAKQSGALRRKRERRVAQRLQGKFLFRTVVVKPDAAANAQIMVSVRTPGEPYARSKVLVVDRGPAVGIDPRIAGKNNTDWR